LVGAFIIIIKVLFNSFKLSIWLLFLNLLQDVSYSTPPNNNDIGTQLQARSWDLANSSLMECITLLVTISDYRQSFLDFKLRDRLSVADAIISIETRVAPDGVVGYTLAEFESYLPISVILFLSSPLSVRCLSYHATYTYLITFDKQI